MFDDKKLELLQAGKTKDFVASLSFSEKVIVLETLRVLKDPSVFESVVDTILTDQMLAELHMTDEMKKLVTSLHISQKIDLLYVLKSLGEQDVYDAVEKIMRDQGRLAACSGSSLG